MKEPSVVTRSPRQVEAEVQRAWCAMFPEDDRPLVSQAFGWTVECFAGRYRDYQAIDARYHDLEHTMQGTLCLTRLLQGRHRAGAEPRLTQQMFELGLLAILLHDTGYLKKRNDTEGTGAKYTLVHVRRSADFAGVLLPEKGFAQREVGAVQRMIQCTGVNADLEAIRFADEPERIVGYALATADLLGQMAASDYVEKLPILYSEFAEAARHTGGQGSLIGSFSSAEELMRDTPRFWEQYVLPRINGPFLGLYRFLNDPYPDGPNEYMRRVEANIERLRRQVAP